MKKIKSFLGQGWAFPPSFARELNTVMLSSEDQNIAENLTILLSTQCGERLMNEDYGTILNSFVFDDPDGHMFNELKDTVQNAILLYEPRISLEGVSVTADPSDPSTILIAIQYIIQTSNSRRNYVYPFHIVEGTNLTQ